MIYTRNGSDELMYHSEHPIIYDGLKQDGSNKFDFYSAGADIRSFERNSAGYIRSDIAAIREQQDMAVANAMLSRLQEIPASNPNAGKTDAEILLMHRSKYCQTPSEMTRYIESQLEFRENEVKASVPSDGTIKFDDSDTHVSDKE